MVSREDMLKAIYRGASLCVWNKLVHNDCEDIDFDCEVCADRYLAEYENQIRNEQLAGKNKE